MPLGSVPSARPYVYGVVPPVAASWNEYALPAVPVGSASVVTRIGGIATLSVIASEPAMPFKSSAWTVNE